MGLDWGSPRALSQQVTSCQFSGAIAITTYGSATRVAVVVALVAGAAEATSGVEAAEAAAVTVARRSRAAAVAAGECAIAILQFLLHVFVTI